ncbi:MAG: spore germination protein [Firmicutes bacterium]|nr:spore germination protein [Bacillota bacterium]
MKWKNIFKKILPGKKTKTYDMEDLDIDERENKIEQLKINNNLKTNVENIRSLFGKSFDLSVRNIELGKGKIPASLVFMAGLSDTQAIEEILEALQLKLLKVNLSEKKGLVKKGNMFEDMVKRALNNKDILLTEEMDIILKNITIGSAVILVDGMDKAIVCETKGFQFRNISEPEAEIVLRGPRDGFVENIFTNTALIRQRIRVPHLWFQNYEMGSLSKINVAIAYIKGLASEELVEEVKSRLERIDIDAVLESGYIEEYLKDEVFTIFPLIKRTERPDKVVSCLLEGKIAILTEGTPFVLIMPYTFTMFLQAADDYYETFPVGSFIRLMRFGSYLMSILLPGFYVAVIDFHSELIPVDLLLRIASTKEGVPFPLIIEALLMETIFEVLREAGLRLPKAIGSAISIVGALILGEAAINAGLASPPMIVIVALTAIASFTVPDFAFGITARLLRFVFLLLGGSLGLFGIQFGIIFILIHLCTLRSFGQPYFQPFGPLVWQDLKDSFVRVPWWSFILRPKLIGGREPQRQKKNQNPEPPVSNKDEHKDEE